LSAGARAGVQSGGKTALQAASSNGHAAIKKLLEELPLERLALTDEATESEAHAEDESGLLQFTHTGVAGASGAAPPGARGSASDDEPLEGVAPEDDNPEDDHAEGGGAQLSIT
jgi:hypothetical protein